MSKIYIGIDDGGQYYIYKNENDIWYVLSIAGDWIGIQYLNIPLEKLKEY